MKKQHNHLWALLLVLLTSMGQLLAWEGMPLPKLHTEGKYLVDSHGNRVNLHGVMMTPNSYFNNGWWQFKSATDQASRNAAYNYLNGVMQILADTVDGPKCDFIRLHLDPCWSNDPSLPRTGDAEGEANISQFSRTLFQTNLQSLFVRLIQAAEKHGLYVILRPPGVCPAVIEADGEYANYLLDVWDMVSQNKYIRNASNVMFELANEPVTVRLPDGSAGTNTQAHFDQMKAIFQPIVDKIRANGADNVIWIPGLAYQSNYAGYARNPIEGENIGYAVHVYPGWYNQSDKNATPEGFIQNFHASVPVVDTAPVVVTELDWSPEKEGEGKYNEFGEWVPANWGTWGTASTTPWGSAYKAMADHFDNVSWNLSGEGCLINKGDIRNPVRAFDGNTETCIVAWDWFREYAQTRYPRPEYTNRSTADNNVAGTYTNPVIDADFPDPDVIRVGDTFYFLSTTMHHFPGATILKSRDLVNWEYCSNPLERLSSGADYNLLEGKNRYGVGMWASALQYHDGKFYLMLNTNDQGAFLLTATDPAGTWSMRKLDRGYYDGGMLFDTDGQVYIACGINHISVCRLDQDFNFQESREVIVRDGQGLEGSHIYHIGDYYYIYSTYGGIPSGQTVFRSTSPFGPYEEKILIEKVINGKPNGVHQGALVDTPTGEWWTFLFEDKGAYGRLPNLQPVRWVDGWPVIGNNGVPYTTYKKPNVGTNVSYPTTYLPTNDNFCDLRLGMQWQWNHQPDNSAWSLLEHPGCLRLHTTGISPTLKQARNTLTQRIFGYHSTTKDTYGTVKMDYSGMQEGDVAGLCVLQDPYALIGIRIRNGKPELVWMLDSITSSSNITPKEELSTFNYQLSTIIYLRAVTNNSTGLAKFYYSLDNQTYTRLGDALEMKFNLSVFVGNRFGLFNYATQAAGGYADFDWFTTEETFDETVYFDDSFTGYSEEQLTCTGLSIGDLTNQYVVLAGSYTGLNLVATFADGHTENVAATATYTYSAEGVCQIVNGEIKGLSEGQITVTANYTDALGHTLTTDFVVSSTFFPLTASHFDPSIIGKGQFDEQTLQLTTGDGGLAGWRYVGGADLSGWKYLVIRLARQQVCNAAVRIYQDNNPGGSYYNRAINNQTQIVIPLGGIVFNVGSQRGRIDPSRIGIVGISSNGTSSIQFEDAYVTNEADYSRPTGIEEMRNGENEKMRNKDAVLFDLSGRKVSSCPLPLTSSHLKKGIYIRNGQKIIIK